MKNLSIQELLNLTGGQEIAWSDCDMVIIAGNHADNTWTDEMWDSWLEAFDRLCQ